MITPAIYKRLRRNTVLYTVFAGIIPLLIVVLLGTQWLYFQYLEKSEWEVESVAQSKGKAVDMFLEERLSQLRAVAAMHSYYELITPGKIAEVFGILQEHFHSYEDLSMVDMQGRHAAYAGAHNVRNVNYKKEPWFMAVQQDGWVISDVFMGFRQAPHIVIAVLRHEGNSSWVLRATINPDVLQSAVQSSTLSTISDSFIVNKDNILQTNSSLAGPSMSESAIPLPLQDSIGYTRKFQGSEMLFVRVPLQYVPWYLVVADDPGVHDYFLVRAKWVSGIMSAAAIIILCVGAWLGYRFLAARLAQAEREKSAFTNGVLHSNKMAAIGKMAAEVAHEVNNPLMMISQTAGWIKDQMEEENPSGMRHYEGIVDSVAKIENQVSRAQTVTHRLLGLARKSGSVTADVHLPSLVEEVIGFLQPKARRRRIGIHKVFFNEEMRLSLDIGQVQQVVLNLLDNALDAAPEGGDVSIRTGRDGDFVFIAVGDNGPGIPKDLLPNIFDPFFTTKAPGEGTGLGLAICHSIVASMGGSIKAGNQEEGGAEFLVRLPIQGASVQLIS